MAPAARNKILLFVIGILLLSNLAMVIFFVTKDPERKPERRGSFMSDALQKEVGFNQDQMASFEKMAAEHMKQIKPLFDDLKKTKESLYKLLNQPDVPYSLVDSITTQVGEKQKAIDLRTFSHFQSIRQLSTSEQRPKLDSLLQKAVRRMIGLAKRDKQKADSLKSDKP